MSPPSYVDLAEENTQLRADLDTARDADRQMCKATAEMAGQNTQLRAELAAAQAQIAALREHLRIATLAPSSRAAICVCHNAAERAMGYCWYCVARRLTEQQEPPC